MNDSKLVHLAVNFRQAVAIAAAEGATWATSIGRDFPHAACDDSSHLLAAFLADNGFPGALRIAGIKGGQREECESHVWLRCCGLVVDITADQFDGYGLPPIIVSDRSAFHESFEVIEDGPADFRLYFADRPEWLGRFRGSYEAVLLHIGSGC